MAPTSFLHLSHSRPGLHIAGQRISSRTDTPDDPHLRQLRDLPRDPSEFRAGYAGDFLDPHTDCVIGQGQKDQSVGWSETEIRVDEILGDKLVQISPPSSVRKSCTGKPYTNPVQESALFNGGESHTVVGSICCPTSEWWSGSSCARALTRVNTPWRGGPFPLEISMSMHFSVSMQNRPTFGSRAENMENFAVDMRQIERIEELAELPGGERSLARTTLRAKFPANREFYREILRFWLSFTHGAERHTAQFTALSQQ
jgi:hypothetical protein